MFVKKFALAVLLATAAYAQESSSPSVEPSVEPTPSIEPTPTASEPALPTSTCLITCATQSSSICPTDDTACVCTNTQYHAAILLCIQSNCPGELDSANQIQQTLCSSFSSLSSGASSLASSLSSVGSSISSRVSSLSSRASSVSSSRSSVAASPTSTGSGGAAGLSVSFLATGGAVLLGVIGGGMLVF